MELTNQLTAQASQLKKSLFDRVGLNDKVLFSHEIAVMLGAGLHLTQALNIFKLQTTNKYFKAVLEDMELTVQEGAQLSQAMSRYPGIFDRVFINVTKSGEASGQLEKQLADLAKQLDRQSRLMSKIKGALIYPAFILVAMIGVAIIATVKIIPALKSVIEGTGKDLPASTKFILGFSDLLIHRWYFIILTLFAIIVAVWAALRSPEGQLVRDRILLKDPTGLAPRIYLARFTRTLGTLVRAGVPIVDAVKIVSDAVGNQVLEQSLQTVAGELERGVPMSVPIQQDKNFPVYVAQMVAVGEQTGQLDKVLFELADYYEDQSDERVKNLSALFEPVIIVIIGIGVGFLVFSILIPIYNVATSIQ